MAKSIFNEDEPKNKEYVSFWIYNQSYPKKNNVFVFGRFVNRNHETTEIKLYVYNNMAAANRRLQCLRELNFEKAKELVLEAIKDEA